MRMPFKSTSVWPKLAPRMEMSDCTPLGARSPRSIDGSRRSTSIQLLKSNSSARSGKMVTDRSSSSSVKGSQVPVTTMESERAGSCCAVAEGDTSSQQMRTRKRATERLRLGWRAFLSHGILQYENLLAGSNEFQALPDFQFLFRFVLAKTLDALVPKLNFARQIGVLLLQRPD